VARGVGARFANSRTVGLAVFGSAVLAVFSLTMELRGAMPGRKRTKRATVKDIRSILRLTREGLSARAISERLGLSKTMVATYRLRQNFMAATRSAAHGSGWRSPPGGRG